jgi:fumarate reductase subunit D
MIHRANKIATAAVAPTVLWIMSIVMPVGKGATWRRTVPRHIFVYGRSTGTKLSVVTLILAAREKI